MHVLADRLPRSWNAALEQLGRDVRVVGRRAVGYGLPPLVPRRSAVASREARPSSAPRELLVARVVTETPSAMTLVLASDDGAPFEFEPGQFFTVVLDVDGETVRRNYSASNAPHESELHLTVKTKAGGKVSPVLCRMREGE